jgi:hypothetical protein
MDAKAFFQEVVLKNYQESKADQASFQKLWNAVVSMNTVPEYVALDRLRYASLLRKEIDQKSDEVRQQYASLKSLNEGAITLKHVRRHISGKLVESSSGIKLTDPTTWRLNDGTTLHSLLDQAFADLSASPDLK